MVDLFFFPFFIFSDILFHLKFKSSPFLRLISNDKYFFHFLFGWNQNQIFNNFRTFTFLIRWSKWFWYDMNYRFVFNTSMFNYKYDKVDLSYRYVLYLIHHCSYSNCWLTYIKKKKSMNIEIEHIEMSDRCKFISPFKLLR